MPFIPVPQGTEGDDAPHLTAADEYYDGLGGNDTIDPGTGNDYIIGGPGLDTLQLNWGAYAPGIGSEGVSALLVNPQAGYDGQFRAPGYAQVQFVSIERFLINATQSNDTVVVGDGDDFVNLDAGNDRVFLGKGEDGADGGSGVDGYGKDFSDRGDNLLIDLASNIFGLNTPNIHNFEYFWNVIGGAGNDTFISTQNRADDVIDGGSGNDVLDAGLSSGGTTRDIVHGGLGNDRLVLSWNYYIGGMVTTISGGAGGYSGSFTTSEGYTAVDFDGIENFTLTATQSNDVITTGDGDDVVDLNAGNDVVHLGKGVDQANGNAGTDGYGKDFTQYNDGVSVDLGAGTVSGAGGNTTVNFEYFAGIMGGSGNDSFKSTQTRADDVIDGGDGNDVLNAGLSSGGTTRDVVHGGSGNDRLVFDWNYYIGGIVTTLSADPADGYRGSFATGEGYTAVDFDGIENFTLTATQSNDVITTGDGDDVIDLNTGNDIVHLGKGVDRADGNAGTDGYGKDFTHYNGGVLVDLGTGMVSGAGSNTAVNFEYFAGIMGGSGSDSFKSTQTRADDVIDGGGGDDVLNAGLSSGGTTHDVVHGGSGNDRLVFDWNYYIGGVVTTISGGAGGYFGSFATGEGYTAVDFDGIENFTITGTQSNDVITTGDGDDVIDLSTGNDIVHLGKGVDRADGGAGTDGYGKDFTQYSGGVSVDLGASTVSGAGGNTLAGFEYFAGVTGGDGNDTFISTWTRASDVINGGSGNDILNPGLSAGDGSWDVVNGGTGSDTLVLDYSLYIGGLGGEGTVLTQDGDGGYSGTFRSGEGYTQVSFTSIEAFSIHGTQRNDVVRLGDGNDYVNGDAGTDTLVLSGNATDYAFYTGDAGAVLVKDLRQPWGQGLDTIVSVEKLQFADTLADVSSLTLVPMPPAPVENRAPTGMATAILAHGTEDMAYTLSAAQLLQGFSDADGDALSVVGLSATNASVVNNGNGTYTLTPAANYNGTVALSYTVSDGRGGTIAASQSVSLDAVNDAPTGMATAILAHGSEDSAYMLSAAQLLHGFADIDGDTLSVSGLSATHASVVNNGNGTYTLLPAANYNGAVALSYSVVDGHGGTIAASQSIVFDAVNDAPVALGNAATMAQNTSVTIATSALLANDSDIDGDSLTVTGVSGAVHGTVSLSGVSVIFTPTSGYSGPASFSYAISDGHGGTASATVNVTVSPVVTPPTGVTSVRLDNLANTVSYARSENKVMVAALGGDDKITGSRFDDTINGGTGNDGLTGGAGNDLLTGGQGADKMVGGEGNDKFLFYAGDLPTTGYDHIFDFHGAGLPVAAGGEQDYLQFFGFSAGTTLVFDRYGGANHALQYYRIFDPLDPSHNGTILVQMADGTAHLTAADYRFG